MGVGAVILHPPYSSMPHKHGFKDLIEAHWPHNKRDLSGIEIGCFKGEFCSFLIKTFGGMKIVTIDPSPFWSNLATLDIDYSRLWVLTLPSDKAHSVLDDNMYDFVFIDGDHSYEQCKKDIINYMPKVKPGGLISGHNFHDDPRSAHPGVHQAVKEIFGDKYKLQPDFTWYVQK